MFEYGKHPFLTPVGGGIGAALMVVPLTPSEIALAEQTGRPDLIMRLKHQRSPGHDPSLPTKKERTKSKLISDAGYVDPALAAMAKQVAEMKTMLSEATGGKEKVTPSEIIKDIINEQSPPQASSNPKDADVPLTDPSKEYVETQCTHDIPAGCSYFEVHSMIGIVVGQILSIG